MLAPNRIAVYFTTLAGLLTALAPAVADLDWTSTAGLAVGALTILGVAVKWLDGWQTYERDLRRPATRDVTKA